MIPLDGESACICVCQELPVENVRRLKESLQTTAIDRDPMDPLGRMESEAGVCEGSAYWCAPVPRDINTINRIARHIRSALPAAPATKVADSRSR